METAIQDKNTQPKAPVKKSHKWHRDKDREMVKGIFNFFEVPGGSMSFVFKAYKEDQVETYHLQDGQIYTLPLGVAKHLNKNVWYPIHGYTQEENGKPSMKINERIRRCGFRSLEFVDIDDLTPVGQPLITAEYNI